MTGTPRSPALAGVPSESEDEADSVVDLAHDRGRKGADPLEEELPVECRQLGDIDHRRLPQARPARPADDVPRGGGQLEVRGERNDHHGAYPARVEGLGLHHENGALRTSTGPPPLPEIRPPQVAASHYHRERRSVARAAFSRKGSRSPGSSP